MAETPRAITLDHASRLAALRPARQSERCGVTLTTPTFVNLFTRLRRPLVEVTKGAAVRPVEKMTSSQAAPRGFPCEIIPFNR